MGTDTWHLTLPRVFVLEISCPEFKIFYDSVVAELDFLMLD